MSAADLIFKHSGQLVTRDGRGLHRLRRVLVGPPTPLDRLKARLARVGDWVLGHTVEWVPREYREDFGRGYWAAT